jgi:osmotically-inducible protein OsmY
MDDSRDYRDDRDDRSDRDDYSSRQRTAGRYRPDYENEERSMNYGGRSQSMRGGEDDRWRESRDRFYNRGQGTGTGSYQQSDYDRQSSYYGAGQESDYERGRRSMGSGQRYENEYDDTGYGQYGRSNRSYEGYRSDPNEDRFYTGRSTSGRTDDDTMRRRTSSQSGYGREFDERGYSAQSDYERRYESRGAGAFGRESQRYSRGTEDREFDARARASQSGYNAQGYGIGPHRGKSPKGYKRSEERIREDICERLMDHGEIDASDIDVKVKGNEVTLEGTVTDWRTKRRAEEVIQDVSGVSDVLNNLRVKPASSQPGDEQTRTMGSETANTAITTTPSQPTGTTSQPTGTTSQSTKGTPSSRQPNA